jgi:hypothetical protein
VNLQASAQQFGGAVADKESVIPRAARIFLAVELALGVAYFVLPASALRASVYCAIELGMVVAVVVGVRTYRPSRPWAWYLLAAGQLCFTVGDAILYAYEWALQVEAPSRRWPTPSTSSSTRCWRSACCCWSAAAPREGTGRA